MAYLTHQLFSIIVILFFRIALFKWSIKNYTLLQKVDYRNRMKPGSVRLNQVIIIRYLNYLDIKKGYRYIIYNPFIVVNW